MSYYTNHMTDPDYIHRIHAKVNGKLNKWRELTLEISDKLKAMKLFREDNLLAQKKWAYKVIMDVMAGLSKLKNVPVTILNLECIMESIRGVEDEEVASFLYNMARCTKFVLVAVPYESEMDAEIITVFDDRQDASKAAYGKFITAKEE